MRLLLIAAFLVLASGCARNPVTIATAADRLSLTASHQVVLIGAIYEARYHEQWGPMDLIALAPTTPSFGYTADLEIIPIQAIAGISPTQPFEIDNLDDPHENYAADPLRHANLCPPFQAIIAYNPRPFAPYADLVLIPLYPLTNPPDLPGARPSVSSPRGDYLLFATAGSPDRVNPDVNAQADDLFDFLDRSQHRNEIRLTGTGNPTYNWSFSCRASALSGIRDAIQSELRNKPSRWSLIHFTFANMP